MLSGMFYRPPNGPDIPDRARIRRWTADGEPDIRSVLHLGTQPSGALSRRKGENMRSYIGRRLRWRQLLETIHRE